MAAGAVGAGGARNETGGGSGEDIVNVIPPPVSPPELEMFEIRGEDFGGVKSTRFIGDLDGDGYDELAVAELAMAGPAGATERETEGALYVFYGRPSFPSRMNVKDADFVLYGIVDTPARLGDLDGDGYDDILFNADCIYTPTSTCPTDGVHVVYGAPERVGGEHRSDEVGIRWISDREGPATRYMGAVSAGDVNGDGHPDILIDMMYVDAADPLATPTQRTCETFLVLGSAVRRTQFAARGTADASFGGSNGEYGPFYGSAPAGDVDGDGFADVLISMVNETTGADSTDSFSALFYGGPDKLQGALTPGDADANLGVSAGAHPLPGLGDLDEDGYDDFWLETTSESDPSVSLLNIVYGRPERFSGSYGLGVADFSASISFPVHGSGGTGDVDGDGNLDLVTSSLTEGAVALLMGTGTRWHGAVSTTPYLALIGDDLPSGAASSGFGYFSAVNGDLNGDGFADLAVVAPSEIDTDRDPGSAFVFLGKKF